MRKREVKPVTAATGLATASPVTFGEGSARAEIDALFSAAYEELKRLAAAVRRSDPAATVSPTGLVNDAWLKLARSPHVAFASHLHFKRIAARAMRQVLIEAARRRQTAKRGREACVVTFTESLDGVTDWGRDLLALNDALDALAKLSPRQAQMVESRFFGGLEIPEIAELLGVSEATVLRDWRASKAWLARELRRDRHRTDRSTE
jgi:RNA polymerase sigma factor (TIGR02999 family)